MNEGEEEKNEKNFSYYHGIDKLFHILGIEHNREEWWFFINSSVRSLKVVLLSNWNLSPNCADRVCHEYEGNI